MSKIKDFIMAVLAYLAGLANTLPKAKTRYQDYMAKAARAIKCGLLPSGGDLEDGDFLKAEGGHWKTQGFEGVADELCEYYEENGLGLLVPKPGSGDAGKVLTAQSDGTYGLRQRYDTHNWLSLKNGSNDGTVFTPVNGGIKTLEENMMVFLKEIANGEGQAGLSIKSGPQSYYVPVQPVVTNGMVLIQATAVMALYNQSDNFTGLANVKFDITLINNTPAITATTNMIIPA